MDGREARVWVYDRRVTDNSGFKLGLHRQPYGIIMYDSRRQSSITCMYHSVISIYTTGGCRCGEGPRRGVWGGAEGRGLGALWDHHV